MPEYIERETAIKALMNDAPEQVGYSREDAADCIRYMNAADVAPVRHGYWIERVHDDGYGEYVLFHCSECDTPNANKRNYCDHCGAKMDGGEPDA